MKALDRRQLERLLGRVTKGRGDVPREVKEVFSVLVATTLEVRDRQLEEFGTPLTVQDVRIALDWLVEFFSSGRLPRTNHPLRRRLFKAWMTRLNARGT